MLEQVSINLALTQLDFLALLNGLLRFTGRRRCDQMLPSTNWTMVSSLRSWDPWSKEFASKKFFFLFLTTTNLSSYKLPTKVHKYSDEH